MTISDEVSEASRALSTIAPGALESALNQALNRFIGEPFAAAPGLMVDEEGTESDRFASLVHIHGSVTADSTYPADTVAAVIDVYDELTIESLRAAYHRIAGAKALKKTPVTTSGPQRTATVGIVFALRSMLSLEAIAVELDRLNAAAPEHRWTDLVAMASIGAIHYAVQFPGQNELNDFLLPDENAKADHPPPIYVLTAIRPTGPQTFNRVLSFLVGHLITFRPGVKPPLPNAIMEGVPASAIVATGYQYNLVGALVPVPRQFHNDRYLPPRPFLINDHRGHAMAAIRFLPWQDGAVIMLQGKLPLEGLLIFLGQKGMQRTVRLGDLQLSYVLPLNHTDFIAFLNTFARRSNMTVISDPGRFVMQKVSDEGTGTPFVARVMLGIMRLRDGVYQTSSDRESFDKTFDHLISSLQGVRDSEREISRLWREHAAKIASGEAVRRLGNDVRILESIDRALKQQVETFLNTSVRTMKTGLQNLGRELRLEIGFLFQKPASFERGVAALEATNPDLAAYLREVRRWSDALIKTRDDLEHSLWKLPGVGYEPTATVVNLREPAIAGQALTEFVSHKLDRLACFVEEFTVHCLQQRMPDGISIAEIPLADRRAEAPERFRLTPVFGGLRIWRITYHASEFDET